MAEAGTALRPARSRSLAALSCSVTSARLTNWSTSPSESTTSGARPPMRSKKLRMTKGTGRARLAWRAKVAAERPKRMVR